MNDNTTRQINESADKIRVDTKTKRGTGTRNQDVIKVQVKGDDPSEVVEKLNATLAELHDTTADELRGMQPGDSE